MLWMALRFPGLDEQLLKLMASWAYSYTPYIQRYGEHSLLLEISRSLRLFGGMQALAARMQESLQQMPHQVHMGVAHTGKGAWLLSHCDYPLCDGDSFETFANRLAEVPLSWPQEHRDAFDGLQKMGLKRIGQVLEIPAAELGRRFGEEFPAYLQELAGCQRKLAELYQAQESFCQQISFNWAVTRTQLLELPARQLLQQLVDYLLRRQHQCQQISWHLYAADGRRQSLVINCERVYRNWSLLFDLTRIRLDALQLGFEVYMLELECGKSTAVDMSGGDLFGHESTRLQTNAEALLARLQNRLGEHCLYQPGIQSEHLPEKAHARLRPLAARVSPAAAIGATVSRGDRPCWLLAKPKPLVREGNHIYWPDQPRRQILRILDGPERIEGYWWAQPEARDYFVARREDALHCWIYRELNSQQNWYVQGVFG